MKIALCQLNPTVGDFDGNVTAILDYARRAQAAGADLAVFPELAVCGYPALDLLDRPQFLDDLEGAIDRIVREAPRGIGLLVGTPVRNPSAVGKRLLNTALLLEDGAILRTVVKQLLPTYDVFDEYRYFEPGPPQDVVLWRGLRLGVHVCEDMWNNRADDPYHLYAANPVDALAAQGVDVFVNLSASPFRAGGPQNRSGIVAENAAEHGVPFVFVNQVGAHTELVFDGGTGVWGPDGTPRCLLDRFVEGMMVWDSEADTVCPPPARTDLDDLHDALVLGVRDYVGKQPFFDKVVLGLSGGIDSALTAALAVEALGPDRVVGVTMPSRYSSEGSVSDSANLARNLGIEFHEVSIRPAVDAFEAMLAPLFAGRAEDVTEENLQARARGVTLMALSNKFGYLLLTTGNKSEMAVGYATLYGDMCGGLAVLSDVFKTDVYRLARHVNDRAGREVIPEPTITKPPSAELRPGQKDQDSLPPYEVLDRILRLYVEEHQDVAAISAATGDDPVLVRRLLDLVDRNEFKRRQAAPGLRVSGKAFGPGRRVPIVMRWRRDETLPLPHAGDGASSSADAVRTTPEGA